MTLQLIVRLMAPSELAMVLSNWKNQLAEERYMTTWGRRLEGSSFWALVNYVIDKITVPSSEIYVACTLTEPETPLCWAAVRRIRNRSKYEVLYLYARHEIRKDPTLAAILEQTFLFEVDNRRPLSTERRPYNPFQELKR